MFCPGPPRHLMLFRTRGFRKEFCCRELHHVMFFSFPQRSSWSNTIVIKKVTDREPFLDHCFPENDCFCSWINFWSWVLLLPRLPPSSRSLRLFPWASILLHGPLDICLDLLPAAPPHQCKKRDAHHIFLQHRVIKWASS